MYRKIEPKIQALVCDVDNTLLNLRVGDYGAILNYDLLIPILRFAFLLMPLAIDTSRDKNLDNHLQKSGAVSVADLLCFMEKKRVKFSPDLIVMSEDVVAKRNEYMQKFDPQSQEWELFVKEKNPDLHLILERLTKKYNKPFKPAKILLLDDAESIVNQAKKAGFRAILVPLDFSPKAQGTSNVEYLDELAKLIGLTAYANDFKRHPEKYKDEPDEALSCAKQFLAAKEKIAKNIPSPLRFVHPELLNLVDFLDKPNELYCILERFRERTGFNRLIDAQMKTKESKFARTLLGMAIISNNYLALTNLLKLGASPNCSFEFNESYLSVQPLDAALLINSQSEILAALFEAKAETQIEKTEVLELALRLFSKNPVVGLVDYNRLRVLSQGLHRQGEEGYFKALSSVFIVIMHRKNPTLLSVFLLNLTRDNKQNLFQLILKDKELKKITDSTPKDEFAKYFLLEFFFQLPLKKMEKISPKRKTQAGQQQVDSDDKIALLCSLVNQIFIGAERKKSPNKSEKRSGSFFNPKLPSDFDKINQLIFYSSFIENYYGGSKLEKDQIEPIAMNISIALTAIESGFFAKLSSAQTEACANLCNLLDKLIQKEGHTNSLRSKLNPKSPSAMPASEREVSEYNPQF